MTSLDKASFRVESLGKQSQSSRKTGPSYSISKVGRDARSKMYLTEEHIKTQEMGRQSLRAGPAYLLKSTLDTEHKVGFGSAPQRADIPGIRRDDVGDVNTNDTLAVTVDAQPFKYRKDPDIIIGTDPRGKLKDADLLKNHSAAFFGRQSPGPAAIGDEFGPSDHISRKRECVRPFGVKLKYPDWQKAGRDLDIHLGPGHYDRKDNAIGKQSLAQRKNQSVHEFPRGAKFAKDRNADSIVQLDAARSAIGKQVLGKNRSMPSINFNCDTRASRDKSMLCMTSLDRGPVVGMPKQTFSMPVLPSEKVIMKTGFG